MASVRYDRFSIRGRLFEFGGVAVNWAQRKYVITLLKPWTGFVMVGLGWTSCQSNKRRRLLTSFSPRCNRLCHLSLLMHNWILSLSQNPNCYESKIVPKVQDFPTTG
jgi:hypothetical protein